MGFQEEMLADIDDVLMNVEEFGSLHRIEGGDPIVCVFDDEALRERQSGQEIGVAESSVLLFAKTSELPPRKGAGSHFNIDGKEYIVNDWSEDLGVSQIALSQTTQM